MRTWLSTPTTHILYSIVAPLCEDAHVSPSHFRASGRFYEDGHGPLLKKTGNLKKEAHRCYLIVIIFMNLFSVNLNQ